jgi:hypothetical protein
MLARSENLKARFLYKIKTLGDEDITASVLAYRLLGLW